MISARPLVTLTSDFGLSDYYVGAMKAVMISVNSDLNLVDLSHEIKAQDIMAGAWILKNSAYLFPAGTVHLAVVDPGVGTERRPVAVYHNGQYFVGPDNGLFSLVTEGAADEVVELRNRDHWRAPQASNTFHGRDIFAPVAAHLASGVPFHDLGPKIESLEIYHWARPTKDSYSIQGWVVHIDRFGNLVTNIPEELVREMGDVSNLRIYVGTQIIRGIVSTYGMVAQGEAVALIGSAGTLEVAVNKGNAAELLGVYQGAQVSVLRDRR